MTTAIDPDLIEAFDDETDDNYARISKGDLDSLRKAAKRSNALAEKVDGFERRDALNAAGLTGLTAAQIDAVARLADDKTPEALRTKATELGFIEAPPAPPAPTDEQIAEHQQLAAAGNGASAPPSLTVTPEDINGWPTDKLMRLNANHPDLFEAALAGEPISLPHGFV